jgi:DNA helicase-2/ATP-dependent DNA helicase PcrA
MYAARTRFIPSGLLAHFETCSWPRAAAADAAAKSARPPVDIRQRLRKVWG